MSATSSTSSVPSYIVDRSKNRFGGQQDEFIRRSDAIVKETAKEILDVLQKNGNLKELYSKLYHKLRGERQQIAIDTKTPNAESFGRMRTHPKAPTLYFTPLGGKAYQEYGSKIKHLLKGLLKTMDSEGVKKKNFNFKIGEQLPRASLIEVELFDREALVEQKLTVDFTPEEVERYGLVRSECDNFSRETLSRLKKNHKDVYQRIGLINKIIAIQKEFPSPKVITKPSGGYILQPPEHEKNLKSRYVRAVVKQEYEGKLYSVCEYFTWTYRDFVTDPYERMQRDSTVVVFHMDAFNIETPAFKDLSVLFERAVRSDEKMLQHNICEFRRFQTFVMPTCRGNSAITEWFERALYLIHGYELGYHKDHHPDLACFATPNVNEYDREYVEGTFHSLSKKD